MDASSEACGRWFSLWHTRSVGETNNLVVVVVDILRTNLKSYRRHGISGRRRTRRPDGHVQKRAPRAAAADGKRYPMYMVPECRPADAVQEEVDGVVRDTERLGYLLPDVNPRKPLRSFSVGPPVLLAVVYHVENHVGQLQADGRYADCNQHDGELALGGLGRVL